MKAKIIEDSRGRRSAEDACLEPCPVERDMRILGGKWTASILWHLGQEPVRFNDLARLMAGASRKVIAERLRHLEQHGLILRKEVATAPPSVKYSVTVHGAAALESLEALRRWTEALPASADVEPEAGTSAQ